MTRSERSPNLHQAMPTPPYVMVVLVGMALAMIAGCGGGNGVIRKANLTAPAERGFIMREVAIDGKVRKYSIFIPHNYDRAKRWPAILFLHGIGEAGSDGVANVGVGLGPVIAENPSSFPFITIFPQSKGAWKSDASHREAIAVLEDVTRHYSVDPERITLTGLSTGGYGTWTLCEKYRNRFAALVPMCAYANLSIADKLRDIPIWCFHNSLDPFVGSGESRQMVQRIKAVGGSIKYTQYDAVGHDVWVRAYHDPELFTWILSQRRPH